MDELNELEGLTTIGTNSRRGGGQNFDIFHDVENQKFTVSDALYAKLNLNNNGFTAHVGNGNVYLSVQPNEDSVSYRGRTGYDKGKEFTSTTTSELMSKVGLVNELSMTEVGVKDGATYFRVEILRDREENQTETINEELVEEHV